MRKKSSRVEARIQLLNHDQKRADITSSDKEWYMYTFQLQKCTNTGYPTSLHDIPFLRLQNWHIKIWQLRVVKIQHKYAIATKVVGFTCFMKGILIVPKRIEAKNKI